jgi:transposase InsO family protein
MWASCLRYHPRRESISQRLLLAFGTLGRAEMVKRCAACQFHAKKIHQPTQELQTIPLTWPFNVWGLDILGLFPRGQGGYRYLYVAIGKFTKCAEVESVRTILARSVVKFIRGLVFRFGVLNHIITDNGSQFTSGLFREYCCRYAIATKEKTTILCLRTFVLFTLHTLLKGIICYLQLNTQQLFG